jgi:hypothetical protein
MLNQHPKKHRHAGTPNSVRDPLVDPGNLSHRYQARSTADLDRPRSRMVVAKPMRAFNTSRAVRASGTEERAQPSCAALPQPKSGSAKPCPIAAQCPRSARWARAWRRKINFDVALQRLYAAKDDRADPSAGQSDAVALIFCSVGTARNAAIATYLQGKTINRSAEAAAGCARKSLRGIAEGLA